MQPSFAVLSVVLALGGIGSPRVLAGASDPISPAMDNTQVDGIDAAQIPPAERESAFTVVHARRPHPSAAAVELQPIPSHPALYTGALPSAQLSRRALSRFRFPVIYPPELVGASVEGSAVLAIVVSPNGEVSAVRVISASDRRFATAVATSLPRWKSSPGCVGDDPVYSLLVERFDFKLK